MKHITLTENETSECPMIGTIQNVTNNEIGFSIFKESFDKALQEHFDIEDITYNPENLKEILIRIFGNEGYEDMVILVDDIQYSVRITETWFY